MSDMNKVLLKGRVGQNPISRVSAKGIQISEFSIAVHKSFKNQNGEWERTTNWINNIAAYNKTADYCNKTLKKGDYVFIEGSLKEVKYIDKSGDQRSYTKIFVDEINILESKSKNENLNQKEELSIDSSTVDENIQQTEFDKFLDDHLPF